MQSDLPKQYLSFHGKTLLQWSITAFLELPALAKVVVVVAPQDPHAAPALAELSTAVPAGRLCIAPVGGATRRDSVLAGLNWLAEPPCCAGAGDTVMVHDAARPGLTRADIERLIAEVGDDPAGGLLALPATDTIKHSASETSARVARTEPRTRLWHAQTPQYFEFERLRGALAAHRDVTDESQAIERLGLQPKLVIGSPRNLKVTRADDLKLLQALW